jgi:hypothetical protein
VRLHNAVAFFAGPVKLQVVRVRARLSVYTLHGFTLHLLRLLHRAQCSGANKTACSAAAATHIRNVTLAVSIPGDREGSSSGTNVGVGARIAFGTGVPAQGCQSVLLTNGGAQGLAHCGKEEALVAGVRIRPPRAALPPA